MANSANKAPYVTVRIPKEPAQEIDKIIQSRLLGYRSRADGKQSLAAKNRTIALPQLRSSLQERKKG